MTKKEIKEFEELCAERNMYRSWAMLPGVEPDLDIPKEWKEVTRGWLPTFYRSGYGTEIGATKAASTSVCHRIGDHAWRDEEYGWSQNARRLYSAKVNALRQARYQATQHYAQQLAAVDKEIQKCLLETET